MACAIERLNLDVIFSIICYLDFDDIVHLGQACRQLTTWLHEESICRYIVLNRIPFAKEAQLARNCHASYKDALHRVYTRQTNLSQAKTDGPMVIGHGSTFVYNDGFLCYLNGNKLLHVLNLHNPAESSITLRARVLWSKSSFGKAVRVNLLSWQDDLLIATTQNVATSKQQIKVAKILKESKPPRLSLLYKRNVSSDRSLFVRQASRDVIIGTYSSENPKKKLPLWTIQQITLPQSRDRIPLIHAKRDLEWFTGSDVGMEVAFTIHSDNYFYAVSSTSNSIADESSGLSYYVCCRFNLGNPQSSTERCRIFRRLTRDGPTHDLWTDLRLEQSERTGGLTIVETRREWVNGSSLQRRSVYITPLHFHAEADDMAGTETTAGNNECSNSSVHHDSEHQIYTLADTKMRYYNASAKSFVDLALYRQAEEFPGQARLRVRICAAQPLSSRDVGLRKVYFPARVLMYPEDDSGNDALDDALSFPLSSQANPRVAAVADQRSIVYMVPKEGSDQPIVCIPFDPTMYRGKSD